MPDEQDHSDVNKKLAIAIALLVVVAVGVLIFFFFFRGERGEGGSPFGTFFGELGDEASRPEKTDPIEHPGGTGSESALPGEERPRLRKISSRPSVGATEYLSKSGATIIRYMESEKGNIYDIELETGREARITNDTLIGIHDAYFGANGNTVIVRFADKYGTIRTEVRDIIADPDPAGASIPASLSDGSRLADNAASVALSPDGSSFFYLATDDAGSAVGRILDIPTRKPVTLFEHPISEWLPQLASDGTLRLTTKPSAEIEGFAYFYNAESRRLEKLFGPKTALTTNYSPSGTKMLYGELLSNLPILGYATVPKSGPAYEEDHAPPLGFSSLPEKCAWAKNEIRIYCGAPSGTVKRTLPDDWYKGVFFFDDAIWMFDFSDGSSRKIASPADDAGVPIDVVYPFVAKDGAELIFTNKRDGYLWALTLGPVADAGDEGAGGEDAPVKPEEAADVLGSDPSPAAAPKDNN